MRICLLMLLFFSSFGCREAVELEPKLEIADFTNDGCGLLIDGTFANPELSKECCLFHDIANWPGGTGEQRNQADQAFMACLEKKTGDPVQANLTH